MQRQLAVSLRRYIYLLITLALVFGAMTLLSALELESVSAHPAAPGEWQWRAPLFLVQESGGGYTLNVYNQRKILEQSAINLTLGVGMTFVILTGGIDLSVGSLLALCNVVFVSTVLGAGGTGSPGVSVLLLGVGMCVLIGTLAGVANGWLSVGFGIPSFIVTLGTMLVFRGIAFWVSGGQTKLLPCPSGWTVSIPIGVSLVAVVAGAVFLSTTAMGRYVYAVGGNLVASTYSGVRTGRVRVLCFALSGFCAGLAGIIYWSRVSTGSYTAAKGAELYAIAAVVLGGTRLAGGEGTIIGTLFGAMIMAVLANGLDSAGVATETQTIIVGCVLIAAACLDSRRGRHGGTVAV
jgi:ribose transport system permease protein